MFDIKVSNSLALFLTFLIPGCGASQHAGFVALNMLDTTETDEEMWFKYFQDQFDELEGPVEAPGPPNPEAARKGFERARVEWEEKKTNANWRIFLVGVPVGVMIGFLIVSSTK